MGQVVTIGLDLAKSVFQVHGVDVADEVVVRRQISKRCSETTAVPPAAGPAADIVNSCGRCPGSLWCDDCRVTAEMHGSTARIERRTHAEHRQRERVEMGVPARRDLEKVTPRQLSLREAHARSPLGQHGHPDLDL